MADHHRETDVVRDPETGRVKGYVERTETVREKRKGGGWLFGLILGAILVAGGIAIYANNQGGYEQAGARTDSALAQAETETRQAANDAGAAIGNAAEEAGDAAEQAGDEAESALN
jgi:hypothetical protein